MQGVELGWEQTALARACSSERRRGPQASRAARAHDAVRLELSQKTAQSEEHWRSWDDWQRYGCAARLQP